MTEERFTDKIEYGCADVLEERDGECPACADTAEERDGECPACADTAEERSESCCADMAGERSETCCAEMAEELGGDCPACSERRTVRAGETKKALLTRLRRIEGQVRGLEGMVEKDAYCPEILVQVSAVTCALNSFSRELLSAHIRGCVRRDILNGDDATVDELCRLLQRLMK